MILPMKISILFFLIILDRIKSGLSSKDSEHLNNYRSSIVDYKSSTDGIIGYDCNPNDLNYTKINLDSLSSCNIKNEETTSVHRKIQLIQRVDDIDVTVDICRVKIFRTVQNCGASGHNSVVTGGVLEYIYELGKERCQNALKTGELCIFCYNGSKKPLRISSLKKMTTTRIPHTFAGWTDNYGFCGGDYYSDPGGSWSNVVVVGWAEIYLNSITVKGSTRENIIHLPGSLKCPLNKLTCQDEDVGELYWKLSLENNCKPSEHLVLYEGMANLTYTGTLQNNYENGIVSVINQGIIFSLRITGEYNICGLVGYQTEHPKLVILMDIRQSPFLLNTMRKAQDMDIFTYINSKFVFTERNLQQNLESLYHNIKLQQCKIMETAMKLLLSLAYTNPTEFAYIKGGGPGYTAMRLGEVLYLSRCSPIVVKLRKTEKCYHELPINVNNRSLFLAPKTRLIQKHGLEVTCNSIFPPVYRLFGNWYQIYKGDVVQTVPPEELNPTPQVTWMYNSPGSLAISGIYTQEDLDNLRDHMMNGPEREAVTSILARGYSGNNPDKQGGSMTYLIDEDEIKTFGDKLKDKLWGSFMSFGSAISGVFGVIMLFRLIKWCVDTLIHGRALYELYGCGIAIFGSIWDSLTLFLLHRKRGYYNKTSTSDVGRSTHKTLNVPQDDPNQVIVQLAPIASAPNQSTEDASPDNRTELSNKHYPYFVQTSNSSFNNCNQ